MKKSEKIFKQIQNNRLIALLTPKNRKDCIRAYELLQPYGIILEIALRSEYAIEGIKAVCDKHPEALVLAGTVMTRQQAEEAIRAGAAGIVSADYIPDVVDVCVESDIMCVPGGLSDVGKQLVHKAEGYGCSLEELRKKYPYQWVYKLFPAYSGQHSHLELPHSWKGPFQDVTIIYTGGITLETLKEAAVMAPAGIFCASALTKHLDEPEKLMEEVKRWKEFLRPEPSPLKAHKTVKRSPSLQPAKVITFGELMMRLSPSPGTRLRQVQNFSLHFGGAEANVAVSLAQFGLSACFVTALPQNDLGENALRTLNSFGVDTRSIIWKEERMGLYYLEHGSGLRPSKVIYDRAHSAFSKLRPEELNWDDVLKDADWFHWTGITPALSDSAAACLRSGLELARKRGITVSVDLNYRKKLWSEEKAREVMTGLMPFVDICIGNEEDPIRIFGLQPKDTDVTAGKVNVEGYRRLTREMVKRFGFKKVAITLRESISASENVWSACLFHGEKFLTGSRHRVWIVDRVGTGDAFTSGLIYSFIKGKTDHEALNFGIAAACIKHSIEGDFNLASVAEVERIAAGETSGRVQR